MKKKDILFKQDDFIFSYRVAGILVQNNKILMQKPKNDDGYSFIGGRLIMRNFWGSVEKRIYGRTAYWYKY